MKATLVLTGAQLAPLVFCVVLRVSEYAERRTDHAVCAMRTCPYLLVVLDCHDEGSHGKGITDGVIPRRSRTVCLRPSVWSAVSLPHYCKVLRWRRDRQNSSHPVFPDSEDKLEVKDFTFKAISLT